MMPGFIIRAVLVITMCELAATLDQSNDEQSPSLLRVKDQRNTTHRVAEISGKERSELFEQVLRSATKLECHAAFQEIERRRRDEVGKLMKIADDKSEASLARFFAIRMLGLYRDRRAIPVLVRNLDWECPNDNFTEGITLFGRHTCATALAEFGTECAVPILRDLAHKKDEGINDEMLLLRVDLLESAYARGSEPWGRDEAVGVVERYIERIPPNSPTAKRNIARLLQKLKQKPSER